MNTRTKLACSVLSGGLALALSTIVPLVVKPGQVGPFSVIIDRFSKSKQAPALVMIDYSVHTFLALQLCEWAGVV